MTGYNRVASFHLSGFRSQLSKWTVPRPPIIYGVPANLPIQRFVGDALFQVCIGMDGVHFNFRHAGVISVEGRWELHDADGNLIDCAREHAGRKAYYVHVIFNKDVTAASVDLPRSFSLTFASGHLLTTYDDSTEFESFSIHPDGLIV